MDKEQPHPPFDTVSRPITFETENDELEFEYEGCIPEIIADINQINENIIELASYSGWYPKLCNIDEAFDFDLKVKLPVGYELISNGHYSANRQIISAAKENDIVIFASNQVERFVYRESNILCVFLCPSDMVKQMEQRAKDLVQANSLFTEKFGCQAPESKTAEIVSVFRPGGGWGYKRGNVTFLSAEFNKTKIQYKDDFHELAHGWWCIANVTTDDWINEGGAEFSAYTAANHIYGSSFAQNYISGCLEKIAASDCNTSIVNTNYTSEHRYLNHYIKTAIMFINAEKEFGDKRVFDLLKNVYQTYKNTRNATTSSFLSLCEEDMRTYFEQYLFTADWNSIRGSSAD